MTRFFELLRIQRRAIFLAAALLTGVGVALGIRLPAAILPEVTFPRIKVIADSGELPGEEMLRSVTRPLEESIHRVSGVVEMRSTTSRGSSEIDLDCRWGSDMNLALQRVQAQIDAVRHELPPETTVEARLMSPALFPVLGISLASKTRSLAELRDLADLALKPELARLPGVAEVVIQGGRKLEARVTLDPAALQARGLTAAGVADVVRRSNEIRSAGLLDLNHELYLGLVDARPPDLTALAAIPVPVAGSAVVPLGDLGRISLEEAPEFTRYAAQSREAVLINLLRQPSASTIGLARATRRWFADHRGVVPPDVSVQTFYDQSDLVRSSVGSVRDSLLVGAILSIIVITIFLGSIPLGLAGAIVLPGAIGLTLLGLTLTGQTLNMMTLGGIAAAVGLVLDDAIVVVEHLAHRAESRREVGRRSAAMGEIFPSLVGSSLCTIAIFGPFTMLGGVTGAFFRVLALSMVFMLSASLLLCVTVLPILSRVRARPSRPPNAPARWLARVLRTVTARPWVAVLPTLVLIGSIVPLRSTMGTGFLPDMDEGSLILDYVLPPGTSLPESEALLKRVEKEIDTTPSVAAWSRRTGDQLGFFITEPNIGDYVLRLKPGRRPSSDEIADDLRGRIESSLPAIEIEFGQLVEDVIGDLTTNPEPIEVRVFGEDKRLDEDKAEQAAEIIGRVRGVVDVKSGVVVSGPNVEIMPDATAARLGLSSEDLADAVAPAVIGLEAGLIPRGARVWPVRVVLPGPAATGETKELAGLPVPAAPQRWMKLGDLAALKVDPGETEIDRDNQRTMVSVTGRLSGRDLGSAVAEIQQELRRKLALPTEMSLQYAGLWAEQQSSFRGLSSVLLGAFASVLLILLVSFRSWRQTGAVLLVVTASLTGVFVALHLARSTFNISSFVGAIMMVGIVSENAYFLVAAHRSALASGATAPEAAAAAARRRTRPILMTTAAGIAALSPLALGLGAGSAILRPLAVAVVGGFLTSAPFLLLALPALLARAGGIE